MTLCACICMYDCMCMDAGATYCITQHIVQLEYLQRYATLLKLIKNILCTMIYEDETIQLSGNPIIQFNDIVRS